MAKKPQREFLELVKEMDAARVLLNDMPIEQEFTQEQITGIDDLRMSAQRLADTAFATIETFEGK